jgi:hypothetical protein
MALTEQQKNEIKRKYSIGVDTQPASPQDERLARIQSLRQDIKSTQGGFMSDIKGIGTDIAESFKSRQEKGQAIAESDSGFAQKSFQALGQGAGFLSDVVGSTVMGGLKALTPQPIQEAVGGAVQSGVEAVAQTDTVQNVIQKYQALDDNTKRNIDALIGFGSLATDVAGGALLKKPVQQAGKAVVETGLNVAKSGVELAKPVINVGKNVVTDTATGVVDFAKRIPVNVAESQAQKESIKALGSKTLQKAAREGVDVLDLQDMKKIPKPERPILKKLADTVKDFAEGKSKNNPFEVVGKPMVQGLKLAQSKATSIGQKIGQIADNLPNFSPADLKQNVFNNLKAVRGLEGIELTKNGLLNFKNTTLATAATKADRIAIQKIFNDAVKNGSSKSKHLLRQELFEVLGGKKKAGLQITGTQEGAYEAVRKGIADSLENVSPQYKALNMEYAKAISPIQKLKKLLGTAGVDEDILKMKAGLLARRLTSTAKSNPEIRQILRDLDRVISTKGKTLLSTERLQDFYNILNKYYDIAPKTGFQNLVKEGVDAGTSVLGMAKQIGAKFAGKSQAVRQKAFEDALKELLSK